MVKKIKINSLDRLLKPKTVLVIGGGVWGKSIVFQLKKIGFKFVRQFKDVKQERLIQLLILKQYFKSTGQHE